jgi:hypothetical protein
MPSKEECAKKFPKGSEEYKKCVAYKGQHAKQQRQAPKPQQGGGGGGY